MQEWEEPLITSIAGEGLLIHPPLLAFECDRGANPPPLLLSDDCSIFLIQLIVRAAFSNFEDRPHYFGLLLKITAKTSASAERHRKNDDCGRLSLLYGTNVDNLNAAHSVVKTRAIACRKREQLCVTNIGCCTAKSDGHLFFRLHPFHILAPATPACPLHFRPFPAPPLHMAVGIILLRLFEKFAENCAVYNGRRTVQNP